jgi:broad specificity phosphatase PhoE
MNTQGTREIHLVRHGPSALASPGTWLSGPAYGRYVAEYDRTGIKRDSQAPPEVATLCARATRVVSSDLPRAMETAERAGPRVPIEISSLLRESSSSLPRWPITMPLFVWDALILGAWRVRQALGFDDYTGTRARAVKAADLLMEVRGTAECLVVVTHGDFRVMLTRELLKRGLTGTSARTDFRNWSVWSFDHPHR